MNQLTTRIIITGVLLLFTLITGVWLSSLGRPMNGLLFNVHKLISLGAVVFLVIVVNQLRKEAGFSPIALGVSVITGLLFLSLFVSGALLSIEKTANPSILLVHRVAPLLAAAVTALTILLLTNGRLAAQ